MLRQGFFYFMKVIKFYIDSFKGISKDIWLLSLIYLINRCGEMVIPFMSLYITKELGWTKTEAGLVLFCFGLGALVGSNIGGYLSDTIGNFKVMALSLFTTAIAFPYIIFFTDFYSLCAWIFLTAICTSSFSPAAFGAVSHYGKKENATRGFSLLRMAINLGVAIGPAIGGILASQVGYDWLFFVDGVTCFFAGIALIKLLGHRNEKPYQKDLKKKMKSPYLDKYLIAFLLLNLINMVAFFQILFAVPVYFREVVGLNEFWVGVFFTVNGILVFTFEMPLVYYIEKTKVFFKAMSLGALMIGLAYLCFISFDHLILGIVFYSLLVAFGEIINFPLIPSLAIRRADENNQGKVMGMVSMMFAMSFTLAPILGLPVVDKIGFNSYWIYAAILPLVSGISLLLLKKKFIASEEANVI